MSTGKEKGDKKEMKKKNRLVVADIGWADTVPEWLMKAVKAERMILGIASMAKPIKEVGDAEACVYLYTLSLRQSMTESYTRIYLYLCTALMERRDQKIPKEIQVRELTKEEERELSELKQELYRTRGGEIQHPLFEALKSLKKGDKPE